MNPPNPNPTGRTRDELDRVAAAEELRPASLSHDGSPRDPVTIWSVTDGADIYVRPVNGPTSAWIRGTRVQHEGRVWAGSVEKDVSFEDSDHTLDDQIDAAYRTNNRHYAAASIDRINGAQTRATTVRLAPRTGAPANKEKES
jgi:hypothetical protein